MSVQLYLPHTTLGEQKSRLAHLSLACGVQDQPVRYVEAGSQVYHVKDNIYLGNTGGGIGATLRAAI